MLFILLRYILTQIQKMSSKMSFSKMFSANKATMKNNSTQQSLTIITNGKNSTDLKMTVGDANQFSSNSKSAARNVHQKFKFKADLTGAKGAILKKERLNLAELGGQAVVENVTQNSHSKIDATSSENSNIIDENINNLKTGDDAVITGQVEMEIVDRIAGKDSTDMEKIHSGGNFLETLGNGGVENEPIMKNLHIQEMEDSTNGQIKTVRQNVMRLMGADGIVREFERSGENWEEICQQESNLED